MNHLMSLVYKPRIFVHVIHFSFIYCFGQAQMLFIHGPLPLLLSKCLSLEEKKNKFNHGWMGFLLQIFIFLTFCIVGGWEREVGLGEGRGKT